LFVLFSELKAFLGLKLNPPFLLSAYIAHNVHLHLLSRTASVI